MLKKLSSPPAATAGTSGDPGNASASSSVGRAQASTPPGLPSGGAPSAGGAGTPAARVDIAVARQAMGRVRQPNKPTLEVGRDTTLLDLPMPRQSARRNTLAGRVAPEEGSPLVLRWSNKRRVPPEEVVAAKIGLHDIVDNTVLAVSPHALSDRGAAFVHGCHKEIDLADSIDPLLAVDISQGIHRAVAASMPPAAPAHDLPKVPTECIALWLDAVDQEAHAQTMPRTAVLVALHDVREEARSLWMQHDLSVESTRRFFEWAQARCRSDKVYRLAGMAGALAKELARHKGAEPPLVRLRDNLNGRVWESAMVEHLVENMPEAVKTATHQMSSFIASRLVDLSPRELSRLHAGLLLMFDDPRPWIRKQPDVQALADIDSPLEGIEALKTILGTPPADGISCVGLHWLVQRFVLVIQQNVSRIADWAQPALDHYTQLVKPVKSLDKEKGAHRVNVAQAAGITLYHQPPVISDREMRFADRATVWSKPDFSPSARSGREAPGADPSLPGLSSAARTQLESGAPFASGMSGSLNLMWYILRDARTKGHAVDSRHALLGSMITLVYNGGHSLHECLWVVNQFRSGHGRPTSFGRGTPDHYVAHYDDFINSFGATETGHCLKESVEVAWQALRDYRREHLAVRPGPSSSGSGRSAEAVAGPSGSRHDI
jgi:hypothetical protein